MYNQIHVDGGFMVGSGIPKNFFWGGGFKKIQLRTVDRQNGDLGVIAP